MNTSFLINENPDLTKFFIKGDDSYVPFRELMYLEEHPLIRPNFITEVSSLMTNVYLLVYLHNLKGEVVTKLEEYGLTLAKNIFDLTEEKAKKATFALRDLFILCNQIIEKFNNETSH